MLVYKVILNLVLLLQFVVNGQQGKTLFRLKPFTFTLRVCLENCTEGDFRQQPKVEGNDIFIQYCYGGSWHYLCGGGVGWTTTLATVACRQLGYSDQGERTYLSKICNKVPICRSKF